MTKRLKSLTSVLITVVMVMSIVSVGVVSVNASQRDDIVSIAISEAENNGGYLGNSTKYNNWNGAAWCAYFVVWCARQAGVTDDIIPESYSCSYIRSWYDKRNLWHISSYYGGNYYPQAGDLVIFDWEHEKEDGDHIGIVTGTDGGYLSTVEGNTNGSGWLMYRPRRMSLSNADIIGYCSPAYNGGSSFDIYDPNNYPFPTRDIYYNSSNVMTGEDVKWVQAVLHKLGYDISVDGSFGPASRSVVRQFQSDYGLEVDGSVGPITRQKLYDLWQQKINPPKYNSITVSKSQYTLTDTVSITVDAPNTLKYTIGIDKEGVGRIITENCSSTYTISASVLGEGKYSSYMTIYNDNNDWIDTNRVEFSIINEVVNNAIDLGTDFYAYIINTSAWKMATVVDDNVQLQSETGKSNQIWYFERQDDCSYKISNVATKNCLDVNNSENNNGTNVLAFRSTENNNQRWYLSLKDGNYVLHPKHATNMALDVNGGSSEDGTNIQIWETNGTLAQTFTIYRLEKPDATTLYVFEGNQYKPTRFSWTKTNNTTHYNLKIYKDKVWDGELIVSVGELKEEIYSANLPAGYYEAYIDSCNNYSWTMSKNIVKFTITEGTPKTINTDFYAYIVNTASDSYLINDKNGNACFNKTNGIEENQKVWYFTRNENDSFTIKSMYDNKVLDVYMDKDENGTNVQIFNQGENYANQQWYFQEIAPYYYIKPAFTGRVLDLNGGVYYDNVNAQIWEKNGTDAQKFKLIEVSYSVSYDTNGGSGSIENQTKTYGKKLTLSNIKPIRTGYDFVGWSTDRNAITAQYQPNSEYKENKDAILYAVWKTNTEIALNKTSLELDIGTNATLTAILTPENDNMTVNWKSSNTNIATVDKNGMVTSVNKGTATITATLSNGEKATCTVTVKKYPESISVNKTSVILGVGQTCTLKTDVTPTDAYTTYSWSSTDKTVATVNSNGKITAKKVGTATIKVKTVNGQIASCKVTVKPAPESVTLKETLNKSMCS